MPQKQAANEQEAGHDTAQDSFTIRDLLSYKVSRTAGIMSRSAALRFRRQCDVSLGEWRTLALLAATPSLSLTQLARQSALDKAQISRVVANLSDRGLIERAPSPAGRRTIALSLSDAGHKIYAELIAAAEERDRAFRARFSDQQLEFLNQALDLLSQTGRELAAHEAALGKGAD